MTDAVATSDSFSNENVAAKFLTQTPHIERNDSTIRSLVKRFTRLSLGFSKKLDNLAAAVALHMAYYDFCWKPATLKGITPAMAAAVVHTLWSFDRLFDEVTTLAASSPA